MRVTPLLLLMSLALAACGGGGGDRLTHEEYAEQANKICAMLDEKNEAIAAPTSPDRLDEFADELIPAYEDALERLKELEPPEDQGRVVDEWIELGDDTLVRLDELRDAARAGDEAETRRILGETSASNQRGNELARELGADTCASE